MILDTNAISAWFKGDAGFLKHLAVASRLFLPTPALGEYRFGILQSTRRADLEDWLAQAEAVTDILDIDSATARHYARIRLELRKTGRPIPLNDLWIAALAIQHGLPVLSNDTHFDSIPAVQRLAW